MKDIKKLIIYLPSGGQFTFEVGQEFQKRGRVVSIASWSSEVNGMFHVKFTDLSNSIVGGQPFLLDY